MKTPFFFLNILIALFFLTSCQTPQEIFLTEIEEILPGEWVMDSVKVVPYPSIQYFDQTFTAPATLRDIGTISIPSFTAQNAQLDAKNKQIIRTQATVNAIPFELIFQDLIPGNHICHVLFHVEQFPNNKELLQFMNETALFTNNYTIEIIDSDHLFISESPGDNQFFLSRQ